MLVRAKAGCGGPSARRSVHTPSSMSSSASHLAPPLTPPPHLPAPYGQMASSLAVPGARTGGRRLGAVLVAFGVCLAALCCALAAQHVVATAGAWASRLAADAAPTPAALPLSSAPQADSPERAVSAGSKDAAVSACAGVEQASRSTGAEPSLPEDMRATGQGAAGAALRFFACARATTVLNERSQVRSAAEAYRAFTGSYPASPQDLLTPDAAGHRYLLAWPGALSASGVIATP